MTAVHPSRSQLGLDRWPAESLLTRSKLTARRGCEGEKRVVGVQGSSQRARAAVAMAGTASGMGDG